MDDSSMTDNDALVPGPTVASILGIKGPLRFRPHGSSQKAHVVLRRVVISDDSSDDGEVNRIVRFSLFAQKRIEVKPGKEILLTVASPDGRFKDQAIIFEGDLPGPDEASDEENDTQVAEEEEDVYIPPVGLPPKMRRAWTKKVEEVSPVVQDVRPTHSSIGVQAEPVCVSASVQAQPVAIAVSVQTKSLGSPRSTQVGPPPLPHHISSAAQTVDPRRYMSLEVQTHDLHTDFSSYGSAQKLLSIEEQEPERERSLSPMELDSPSITPPDSPAFSPTAVPDLIAKLSILPPSPTSSIASSSGAQDMQVSPIDTGSSPNLLDDIPYLPLDPHPVSPTGKALDPRAAFPYPLAIPKSPSPELSVTSNLAFLHAIDIIDKAIARHDAALPDSRREGISDIPNGPENAARNPNSPARPVKSNVHNPFVSAGFMTDFVAASDKPAPPPDAKTAPFTNTDITILPGPPPPSQPLAPPTPPRPSTPMYHGDREPYSPYTHPYAQPATTPVTRVSPTQNAVASSSKLMLDRMPTGPPSQPRALDPLRSSTLLSGRALEKSPVMIADFVMPSVPAGQLAPLSNGSHSLVVNTRRSSPPPTPGSLAYIPSGPSSNPLNIRPSANPMYRPPTQRPPPTAPKVLSQQQTPAKKPVVVGVGWPFVRASNGGGLAPNVAPTPPTSAPAPPPLPAPATAAPPLRDILPLPPTSAQLSGILSYVSPSPPPVQPSPSKWKRVISDFPPMVTQWGTGLTPPISPLMNGMQHYPHHGYEQNGKASDSPQTDSPVDSTPRSASSQVSLASASPQPPLPGRPSHSFEHEMESRRSDYASSPSPIRRDSSPKDRMRGLPATPVVPVPQPLTHPLPPKPMGPQRGVKRERPLTPELPAESPRRRRRVFRWPTVDSNYTVSLKGDGDLAVRNIAFSSDGSHFALSCADRTIRIWNNRNRAEIARLSHNAPVLSVVWLEGDSGVVSLGEDGIIGKWTRTGQNQWQWAKILDAGTERRSDDDHICLAYMRDRIAVSFPRTGVKVWVWLKGTWQSQRSILRQNVSAVKFVEDGAALLGGTRDGVLWYCEIPNGTLRAYAFLKTKITSLDISHNGAHVLVGQIGGSARLVGIRQPDNRGSVEQSYSCKETEARPNGGFGALFATQGQAILFGSVEGCVLVWDRKKGAIVYGLEHEEDDLIQAVASFDGISQKDGCLITGTKQGQLMWWSQPVAAPQADDAQKRMKLGV